MTDTKNMTCDAIQTITKNLKSMIKIEVNFYIMLLVSNAKIIKVDSHFYDFIKFRFQLGFP